MKLYRITLSLMLFFMFINIVNAQTHKVVSTDSITSQDSSVGILDLRDKDIETTDKVVGAASSGQHIVLYYLGNDIELINKFRAQAMEAKKMGVPIRGMVLGVSDPKFKNGKDSFLIVLDGVSSIKQADAAENLDIVKELLIRCMEKNKKRLGIKE